jgi:hypothetical protein
VRSVAGLRECIPWCAAGLVAHWSKVVWQAALGAWVHARLRGWSARRVTDLDEGALGCRGALHHLMHHDLRGAAGRGSVRRWSPRAGSCSAAAVAACWWHRAGSRSCSSRRRGRYTDKQVRVRVRVRGRGAPGLRAGQSRW